MVNAISYSFLLAIKAVARTFYRHDMAWLHPVDGDDPWMDIRLVAFLHHTSLYEPIFAGGVPNRFLREIATRGLVPVADKTIERPIVGRFFRLVAPDVVPITRRRDHTWEEFAKSIQDRSMVVILPEGRMMRSTGLDKDGKPMTVRGGICDIIEALGEGRMLMAYSGGLHHVQAPGQLAPRIFRTVRMRFELIDIAGYRAELLAEHGPRRLKKAMVADLQARRDRNCPTDANLRAAASAGAEAAQSS